MLRTGTQAPVVAGVRFDGVEVSIGKPTGDCQVVYFYPKAFTPGCTREACSFRDEYAALAAIGGAQITAVSRDGPLTLDRFRREHRLPFDLVSDRSGAIVRAYGAAYLGGLLPLTQRVTYVLDGAGVVRGAFRSELSIEAHAQQAAQCLAEIKRA